MNSPSPVIPTSPVQNPTPMQPVPKRRMHPVLLCGIIVAALLISCTVYAYFTASWPFVPAGTPVASESPSPSASAAVTGQRTYTNTQYGFEFESPTEIEMLISNSTVTVGGKTYTTTQFTNAADNPVVRVIRAWTNPSQTPYDMERESIRKNISGTVWYLFYDPTAGKSQCESAVGQTLSKDGQSTIEISVFDERYCPGSNDPDTAASMLFLERVLATFRFTR